jgi:hypothetical protein
LAGVALMALVGLRWPGSQLITDAIDRARELNSRRVRIQIPAVLRATEVAQAGIVAGMAVADRARRLDESSAGEAAPPVRRRSTANV